MQGRCDYPGRQRPRKVSTVFKITKHRYRTPSTTWDPPNSASTLRKGVCWRVWLAAYGKWGAATHLVLPHVHLTIICTQCRSLPSAANPRAFSQAVKALSRLNVSPSTPKPLNALMVAEIAGTTPYGPRSYSRRCLLYVGNVATGRKRCVCSTYLYLLIPFLSRPENT